jgi:hypothetical protein
MFRGILAAAGVAAFSLAAGAASAELARWDQERVAKYAAELKLATADLKRAVDGVGILNVAQQNALYQVRDTVEMLDTAANGLDHALRNGKGREETMPRYKRVETLRRDAEEEGRSADIPEAVFEKVFPVGAALLKLRPYYVAEPPQGEPPAAP